MKTVQYFNRLTTSLLSPANRKHSSPDHLSSFPEPAEPKQVWQNRIPNDAARVEPAARREQDLSLAAGLGSPCLPLVTARQRLTRDVREGKAKGNVSGFDYSGVCRPTEDLLDGFLECFSPAPGDVALLIGQGSDTRNPDTFCSSLIVHYFHAAVTKGRGIDSRLACDLNDIVCDSCVSKGSVTCFCAYYSGKTKVLRYCNAGHRPPFLVRTTTGAVFRLEKGGLALGLKQTGRYQEAALHLRAGDRLLAFTQGVVESWATPDDIAAEAALIRLLRAWSNESAVEIASLIVDDAPVPAASTPIDRIAIAASVNRTDLVAGALHLCSSVTR